MDGTPRGKTGKEQIKKKKKVRSERRDKVNLTVFGFCFVFD